MISETIVLLSREIKKWINRKPVLIMSLVTPILWIALFGKSFNLQYLMRPPQGGANLPPQVVKLMEEIMKQRLIQLFGTTDYFTFISSGMIVVFAVFQGMFSGVSIIFDKRLGYMDRLLVAPIPRISIWASKVLAVTVRLTILSGLLFGTAVALGMKLKPDLTILDLFEAWLVTMILGVGMASFYAVVSFYASNQEVVFALSNLINLPLMFTSSAMFPVEQMPSWLQKIAKVNPVTYAANLVRYNLIGRPISNYWHDFAILLTITVIISMISAVLSIRYMENR